MESALFGQWKRVGDYRQHKLAYLEQTGLIETYLGDRIQAEKDKAYTIAVNYGNQGNTAVVANEAFQNAIMEIRKLGIPVFAECIVHDSNTNNLPLEYLYEADLCYQRYFRQFIREKYGIDFKYDLDLGRDSCNNMSYHLDMETRICKISGIREDVDYVMSYLGKQDITMIKDEIKDIWKDPLDNFFKDSNDRSHMICDLPDFQHHESRSVEFRVNRYIKGEETYGKPIGVPYYFDKVKKWYEHETPGLNGLEDGIVDNPNKIYPVEEMDKLMKSL